jgi:hypothetical protein
MLGLNARIQHYASAEQRTFIPIYEVVTAIFSTPFQV